MKPFFLFALLFLAQKSIGQAGVWHDWATSKKGIADPATGEPMTRAEFDQAKPSYWLDTLFFVKKDGLFGLVSATGRTVVSPVFEDVPDDFQAGLTEGFVSAKSGGLLGIYSIQTGRLLLPFEFEWVRGLRPDLLAARRKGSENVEFFDEKGQKRFEIKGQTAWPGFDETSFLVIGTDQSRRYFGLDGQPFFTEKFKNAHWTNGKIIAVAQIDEKGMMGKQALLTVAGDTILGFDDHHFWPISGDRLVVRWGKNRPSRFGLLDGSGAFLWPMAEGNLNSECAKKEPEAAFSTFKEGQALTRIFDKNGQTIIDSVQNYWLTDDPLLKQKGPNYHRTWHFAIQKPAQKGTLGLVSWRGKMVVPLEWDEIFYRSDDHPVVASRTVGGQKKCNAFDLRTGQKLFAADVENIFFTTSLNGFLVKKGEKWGYVSTAYPDQARFEFDEIQPLSTGGFKGRKGKKWQPISPKGIPLDEAATFDDMLAPNAAQFFKFREKGGQKGQLMAIGSKGDKLYSITFSSGTFNFFEKMAAPSLDDDVPPPMIENVRHDD